MLLFKAKVRMIRYEGGGGIINMYFGNITINETCPINWTLGSDINFYPIQ